MPGNFGVCPCLRSWNQTLLSKQHSQCNFVQNLGFSALFYISQEYLDREFFKCDDDDDDVCQTSITENTDSLQDSQIVSQT